MQRMHSIMHFRQAPKGISIVLILVLALFLAACGQGPAEQAPAEQAPTEQEGMDETGDPDVSEQADDVVQEAEELAEASGEEVEHEAEQAGTAAAETGEDIEEGAEQVGENVEEGAEQAGTAAAETGEDIEEGAEQVGEDIEEGAEQVGEDIEEGAEQAGTAAAETGEEIEEEAAGILPQELRGVEGITISKLDDNLDDYIGQTVGVRGDIVESIGTNSFQLSDPSILGGDEILVVGPNLDTNAINTGNTVEVSGTVYRFNLSKIEADTGLDLQDDLFTDWDEDNAVLVAQEILNVADIDGS